MQSNIAIEVEFKNHRKTRSKRKKEINRNKKGSVRKINGKVYVDFYYLGERARESSNLSWNNKNVVTVRKQLDRINSAIELGTFRYADVFPYSKKSDYFTNKEQKTMGITLQPNQVVCSEYIWNWYELLKGSGRVTERTLLSYREILNNYLEPYFGNLCFDQLNCVTFNKFYVWARNKKYRGFQISNVRLNRCISIFKMIYNSAVIEYGWNESFNPFRGLKKLPTDDSYEKIHPFSIQEQNRLIEHLPIHWKPYFKFAFCSGLRQGEQIALKPEDIDWNSGLLHIRRAMTRDIEGKPIEGKTKNKYSRRTIRLIPVMQEILKEQKEILSRFENTVYFFTSPSGSRVYVSNLRRRVWIPTLQKAGLKIREMKQTRHSFATNALGCGENPLWIAKVLGHRNVEMIIKVYSKYIDNDDSYDGNSFGQLYQAYQ